LQIYKITNTLNDKIYIGQTIRSLSDRWSVHKNYAKNNKFKTKIANAMRKYGIENFKIETLCTCNNIDELNELEEFLIQEANSIECGYNIRYGGNNFKTNPETIEKLKKIKQSDEYIQFLKQSRIGEGNPMYGKKLSPKTILKRTETFKRNGKTIGKKLTPEHIAKRTETRKLNRLKKVLNG